MKKAFLACACCLAALSTFAGTTKDEGIHFGTAKDTTDYMIAAPRANWYLTAGVGANALIGNEYESSARFTGITPTIYLEVGKWVLPDVAVAFNLSGFSMKGQTIYSLQPNAPFDAFVNPTGTGVTFQEGVYTQFKEYGFTANGEVILDWTNFLLGFDKGEKKIWHFETPVGFGLAYQKGPEKNLHRLEKGANYHGNFEFDATFGVRNDFRINERFSIVNDIRWMVTRGSWDYSGSNFTEGQGHETPSIDQLPAITVGVQYFLSGKEASRSKDGYAANELGSSRFFANTNGYRDDIRDLEAENKDLKKALDEMQGIIDNLRNKPATVKYVEKEGAENPITVYFKIDRWALSAESKAILKSYANVINSSDDDAKYYIIGGADEATGSVQRNIFLSNNRANVAYDYLVNKCGVSADKLEKRALGGIAEFEPIEMNRMTIVCPQNHRLAQIIDKYANLTDGQEEAETK